MEDRQTSMVEDTVRTVLSDGEFHSYRELFREVAMAGRARPSWQDVAYAANRFGESGFVIKLKP